MLFCGCFVLYDLTKAVEEEAEDDRIDEAVDGAYTDGADPDENEAPAKVPKDGDAAVVEV